MVIRQQRFVRGDVRRDILLVRLDLGRLVRVAADPIRRLQQRAGNGGGLLRIFLGQLAANDGVAAVAGLERLVVAVAQQPDVIFLVDGLLGGRIPDDERLNLAFVRRRGQLLRRVSPPLDVLLRVQPALLQRDGQRNLRAAADDVDADRFAFQPLQIGDSRVSRRHKLNAAGVKAARQLHVEPLLDRLEPGEVAYRAVHLPRRDARLQRLEVLLDELDVEPFLLEEAFLDRGIDWRFASAARISESDLLERLLASRLFALRRRFAARGVLVPAFAAARQQRDRRENRYGRQP